LPYIPVGNYKGYIVINKFYHFIRLVRAGYVMAREGVFSHIDPTLLPVNTRFALTCAKIIARKNASENKHRLATAMARLGPSYVKLGQFLATRSDIVGAEIVHDLESLQDRMEPFPHHEAIAIVERSFNCSIHDLFDEFGPAVAAASIAQVHKAKLKHSDSDQWVAVKILRPGIERKFARDLRDMFFAAHYAEEHYAEARRLKLIDVVETLARSVRMEMDFRLEAAAASEFAENTQSDSLFRVPRINWDYTARDVLTLEWIDGTALSDIPSLKRQEFDLNHLGQLVIQSFLQHAVRDGFFHADMHQGNLLIDGQGRLVAVDFGIMGRLGFKEQRFLAEILYGFITRDYRHVAQVHFDAGYVPAHYRVDDFTQAIRAIGEPIHSRTADQISMAKLLTLLFEITALFDMRTRTELVLLQKTMVVVEGVARSLDPKINIWSTAEPIVRHWVEESIGPKGKLRDAERGLAALTRMIQQGPVLIEQSSAVLARLDEALNKGWTLSQSSLDGIGRAEARRSRWTSLALWLMLTLLTYVVLRH
jgi:ubiquinone biosynthesis protein